VALAALCVNFIDIFNPVVKVGWSLSCVYQLVWKHE